MSNPNATQPKTALITGASSGIGYELARIFAQNGHNLVLVARTQQRLDDIAQDLNQSFGVKATVLVKDLSTPGASEEIVADLRNLGIDVDFLVNNAGFSIYGEFSNTDLQSQIEMIQVNITALTQLTKLMLPSMLKRNYGKILIIGSTAGFAPGPLTAVYSATKAYVLSFSEALAEELKDTKITVTVLCPGPTKTGFAERSKMSDSNIFQGNIMDANTVAGIGFRALMQGKTTIIAGTANKLTVFSMRLTPRKIVAKIAGNLLRRKAS